jgi:hypothetical protein
MVAGQLVNTGLRVPSRPWRRPLVVTVALTAVLAFLAWIAVLALTLPTRYLANHWNVAWVGFEPPHPAPQPPSSVSGSPPAWSCPSLPGWRGPPPAALG